MVYNITWDFQAREDLRKLYTFLSEKNITAANRLVSDISKKIRLLINNPFLAPVESLLDGKRNTYHSLVVRNYKVIYTVGNAVVIRTLEIGFNPCYFGRYERIKTCRNRPSDHIDAKTVNFYFSLFLTLEIVCREHPSKY